MKTIRYRTEWAVLLLFFALCRALPVDKASAIGGWIGRLVGPRLAASRKALANIAEALPDKGEAERKIILRDMWDNLGRVMAEYPHLGQIAGERTTVQDIGLFHRIRDDGQPALIIAAHLANWEVAGPAALLQGGFELDLVYRAPNNPWTDKLLKEARAVRPDLRTMPKSKAGARQIMQSLKENRHVGILIDQKYNEGIPVPFFGRPAMTSPAAVQLAQKFRCPLVMARLERLDKARFSITATEIPYLDDAGNPLPAETVLATIHGHLERWIRERPGQWLWLHRRWPSQAALETSSV